MPATSLRRHVLGINRSSTARVRSHQFCHPFKFLLFGMILWLSSSPMAHADFPAVTAWNSTTPGIYSSPEEACRAERGWWFGFGFIGTYYSYQWNTPDVNANCYESAIINGVFATNNVFQTTKYLACPEGYRLLSTGMCTLSGDPAPGPNCGDPGCNGRSNPVNVATGNKYEYENDLKLSGPNALSFSRHYGYTTSSATTLPYTSMGANWRHDYDRSISVFNDKNGNKMFTSVTQSDGKQFYYVLDTTTGTWSGATPNLTETLVRQTDAGGNTTGWQYSKRDGSVETYDANGKLITISDRSGLTQSLSYDASGRLASITDPFGRNLTLAYGTNGLISTFTDPAGMVTTFSYSVNGNLARSNLVRVTYPDNTAKIYHYENTSFPNSLTGISYVGTSGAATRFATYVYDAYGRVISSEHAGGQEKSYFPTIRHLRGPSRMQLVGRRS